MAQVTNMRCVVELERTLPAQLAGCTGAGKSTHVPTRGQDNQRIVLRQILLSASETCVERELKRYP